MKVRIRNSEGKYLAGQDTGWAFSEDSSKAIVFDYLAHHVEEQLQIIRESQGLYLEAVQVDPAEVLEICDVCKKWVSPFSVAYDGKSFLCHECLFRP